jgi:ubiquinone/menaquinone biosynthesis C-methylase UbiE
MEKAILSQLLRKLVQKAKQIYREVGSTNLGELLPAGATPTSIQPAPIVIENSMNADSGDRQTSTRYTLDESWQDLQKKIDWMAAPTMADYVNGLVSGKPLSENGHWALYARDQHIIPLHARCHGKVEMVSLACGSGHIEESLIKSFNWPVSSFLGLEYDDHLRASAADRFSQITHCQSRFDFFDFNASDFSQQKFDIVFTCHSIHHATDLEGLLEKMNRMLKPSGIIVGIDYFGPTRFQIEYDVLPILEELFSYLSPELRRNLTSPEMRVQDTFTYDTFETVRTIDPSESVRSSDLRTLLFSNFPVIDIKPMGGTLLRWLLQNRAGNFSPNNPNHVTIVRLLQFIERELIASHRIKSDDLFFVLGKSNRIKD